MHWNLYNLVTVGSTDLHGCYGYRVRSSEDLEGGGMDDNRNHKKWLLVAGGMSWTSF